MINSLAKERRQTLLLALGAFALVFVMWQADLAAPLLYPFRLLVTFVHEAGHGLAALLSGGRFIEFQVFANGAGVTTTAGGSRLLILPAGYLGAALFGAVLLYAANRMRSVRLLTLILGVFFAGIALLFTQERRTTLLIGAGIAVVLWVLAGDGSGRNANVLRLLAGGAAALTVIAVLTNTALVVGLLAGALIILLGVYATRPVTVFVLNALAFIIGLNALNDVWSLWNNRFGKLGVVSNDALAFAELTRTPVEVWIILWVLAAIAIMGASVWLTFVRRD